ncbi:MAG: hypothetical protein NT004_03840 [Bacteroidetes bacterium]|nr:hypothetical protein [Bacteroidota bacterium]
MKTRITIFLLLLSSTALCAPPKSYAKHNKGYFFDAGISVGGRFPKNIDPKLIIEAFTTHGYQFSNTFSLGAGLSTYNTETINIYLQLRFNLRNINETRTSYPYISLRGGYSWSTWTGDTWGDDKGPIVDPHIGWSFFTKEANLRWSVFVSPGFYQFNFIPKIGLAFEF